MPFSFEFDVCSKQAKRLHLNDKDNSYRLHASDARHYINYKSLKKATANTHSVTRRQQDINPVTWIHLTGAEAGPSGGLMLIAD